MLILPIKRKWLDMIRSGEKKEEYREISRYYEARFKKYLGWYRPSRLKGEVEDAFRKMSPRGVPFDGIVLRGGYNPLSPAVLIKGSMAIGEGKPEWGAESGKEYFVLRIEEVEDLLTSDWKGD